jgi:hypothetical protein
MGAGPARRRVGRRDELRSDLGRGSERRIVEHGEILVDGPAGQLGRQTFGSLDTLLPIGLGLDQAGIDGKALAADQTFPMQRRTTVSNKRRSRSLSRKRPCRFFEKVE